MRIIYIYENVLHYKWTCNQCKKVHKMTKKELESKSGSVIHCTTEGCRGVAAVMPAKEKYKICT